MTHQFTLPNFLIIGSAKCGTTTLHRQLGQHPEIFMSEPKELNYFDEPHQWRLHLTSIPNNNTKGIGWYCKQFEAGADLKIRGESSVSYSMETAAPAAVRNIATALSDLKIVYIVRNPVDRIRSHYIQWLYNEHISPDLTLEQILNSDPEGDCLESFFFREFVHSSLYFTQLKRYLDYFRQETIKVYFLEELRQEPSRLYRKIFRFLDVDDDYELPELEKIYKRSEDKKIVRWPLNNPNIFKIDVLRIRKRLPKFLKQWLINLRSVRYQHDILSRISERNREKLDQLFLPDIRRLEDYTKKDLSRWLDRVQ